MSEANPQESSNKGKFAVAGLAVAAVTGGGALAAATGESAPQKVEIADSVTTTSVPETTTSEAPTTTEATTTTEAPIVKEVNEKGIKSITMDPSTHTTEVKVSSTNSVAEGIGNLGNAGELAQHIDVSQADQSKIKETEEALAKQIEDLYNQGIGIDNMHQEFPEFGTVSTRVINSANDGSGYYSLTVIRSKADNSLKNVVIGTYKGAYQKEVDPAEGYNVTFLTDPDTGSHAITLEHPNGYTPKGVPTSVDANTFNSFSESLKSTVLMAGDGAPLTNL